ncbi:hypothetical protein [Pseudoalteromonas sp. B160]|uniref:hypothetical protein n=1 Tax=Pseudoalteromonas sp. B160 TaxID=630414 RepID=UPI00301DEF6C
MERLPKHYSLLSTIAELKKNKLDFLSADPDRVTDNKSTLYLTKLLNLPVSSISIFDDTEWDFNLENPNASANITGSKLKINFSKYKNIPPYVIIELKCMLLSVQLTPEVFINNRKKAKKTNITKLATNTILGHFKSGFRFLDTLFRVLKVKLGNEHIEKIYSSLTQVQAIDYRETAQVHTNTYNDDLRQFFSYLLNPYTSEHIFGENIPAFDPDQFSWKKDIRRKYQTK